MVLQNNSSRDLRTPDGRFQVEALETCHELFKTWLLPDLRKIQRRDVAIHLLNHLCESRSKMK